MILKAKAVLGDVKAFERTATAVRDYSNKLRLGSICIEELKREIQDRNYMLTESIGNLNSAKGQLDSKHREVEDILNELTAQLNELKEERSDLEYELANTSPYYEDTDENGVTKYHQNPEYGSLKSQIADVTSQINHVRAEMVPHEERFQRIRSLEGRVTLKMKEIEGIAHSLRSQETECRELLYEYEEMRKVTEKTSNTASEDLKKLEKVIEKYKRSKMKYDSGKLPLSNLPIGINIAVNVINAIPNQMDEQNDLYEVDANVVDAQETSTGHVVYDAEGHICEYFGRTFGGRYNSYQTRYDATSKPDPMLGWYDGQRGESKYIPSLRTAEGVAVTEILKGYGLDGIIYRNAEPDFEDCAEAVVTIPHMTEYRDINFPQADIELAKQWNKNAKDGRSNWHPEDVELYRKANSLSWHEKCDTMTMVLIRSEINLYFKHIGGVSECKVRDAANVVGSEFDE